MPEPLTVETPRRRRDPFTELFACLKCEGIAAPFRISKEEDKLLISARCSACGMVQTIERWSETV